MEGIRIVSRIEVVNSRDFVLEIERKERMALSMKKIKKLLSVVIAVVIICGLSISAVAYDDSEENIWVYSQECPSAVEEYMEENYSRFLIAAIESDTIQVGEHICVGSPFAMSEKKMLLMFIIFRLSLMKWL